jgi:hypothetical protein
VNSQTGTALVAATTDKSELVGAAAFDALARRGDPALLPNAASGLTDEKGEAKLTAPAAVVYLSRMSK